MAIFMAVMWYLQQFNLFKTATLHSGVLHEQVAYFGEFGELYKQGEWHYFSRVFQ
jgi:hypothetical protein